MRPGDFVVAWQGISQDGSGHGIYARRFDSVGLPLSTEFRVNTTTANSQQFPRDCHGCDGDFVSHGIAPAKTEASTASMRSVSIRKVWLKAMVSREHLYCFGTALACDCHG